MRSATRTRLRLALLAILASGWACNPPAPADDRSLEEKVAAFRTEKDAAFKAADSPIPAAERPAFTGLAYFPIDPAYHVPAKLTEDRSAPAQIITLQTSTNVPRRMRRVGTLGFALGGEPYTLTAYADLDAGNIDRLFVPFTDQTSGTDTYKGGRYIELDRTPTGLYDLDFNRAFNPFCVYNPTYECPVPPRENRLAVAVRAGEKLPRGK
jgi:uncharacterized protein (DUF1684 family)